MPTRLPDSRELTPGFKRQLVVLNAETRSLKRAKIVAERILGLKVSTNTIERICLDFCEDIAVAEQQQWKGVIDGEVPVPSLTIVEFHGGRIRTRKTGCEPGGHLDAKGWDETKNAIFVSASKKKKRRRRQAQTAAMFSGTRSRCEAGGEHEHQGKHGTKRRCVR